MMRVVDLFAGCGGMSLGFEQAGFEVVAAFDNWEAAVRTYEKNFKHPIQTVDLSNTNHVLINKYQADVIIGGPPCQDFSSAGKRDEALGRADLTLSFAKIIAKTLPEHFVMENVDLAQKSKAYQQAKHKLEATGYNVKEIILNAAYCGVPQSRKRLFVFGELRPRSGNVLDFIQTNLAREELTIRLLARNLILTIITVTRAATPDVQFLAWTSLALLSEVSTAPCHQPTHYILEMPFKI
jgi:DNA (cytosine-5)-methyltransferase 1